MIFTKLRPLLLFFLCIPVLAHAQRVFVANDFGNCGVGLRDSSGHWLAEPVYQHIDEWPMGYYRVLLGSKEGVLDSTGKMRIPPVYDYISYDEVHTGTTSHLLFTVTQDVQSGLLNEQDAFVVPLVCRNIYVAKNGTIVAEKAKKRYSIYTYEGKETVIPGRQSSMPLPLGDHLLRVSRRALHIEHKNRYAYSEWTDVRVKGGLILKKKYGVMNDSLHMILPKKFTEIIYSPGNYKVIGVERKNKTGYYSREGKQIWAPVFSNDIYFWQSKYVGDSVQNMFNYTGFTIAEYKGKQGIIGMNGDTILPFIYDGINSPYSYRTNTGTTWVVTKNHLQGTYNVQTGKWILPADFELLIPISSYAVTDSLQPGNGEMTLRVFTGKKNGKYGIITSGGQEMLPFIYDDFSEVPDGLVFRNGGTYVQVSFPDCSGTPFLWMNRNDEHIVRNAPASLLFQKITAENGVTLFIDPRLLTDTLQEEVYRHPLKNHVSNTETYGHRLHATAVVITPLSPSAKFPGISNTWYFHSTNLDYLPADSSYDYMICPGKVLQVQLILPVSRDSFHTYYQVGHSGKIFREDGLMLSPARAGSYMRPVFLLNGLRCFILNTGENKTGLLDGNGKLIVDTIYADVSESNGRYAWVQKKKSLFRAGAWNILDLSTNELLLPKKTGAIETSSFGNAGVIVETRSGDKLFDPSSKKFILDGKLNEAFPLDAQGNYYAIRTCFGHIGILAANGAWLADTCWKTLIDANNTGDPAQVMQRNPFYQGSPYKYCVLSNDTGWIIFDGTRGEMTKDTQRMHLLLQLAGKGVVNGTDAADGLKKICPACPSYSYDEENAGANLGAWEEKLLFDSLFTGEHFIADTLFFWHDELCTDCAKKNPNTVFQYAWSKNYDRESLHHYISFCNDSCLSVSRVMINSYWYLPSNPRDLFFTVMLSADGPHTLLLDSLFEGTAWKKMISDEVTGYFESHPRIEGNCHNPAMLPLMMQDRFVLTAEGILLFPPNYKEDRQQLSVLIPWRTAKPYLRKDIIRKLGI